jgi:AcrR family transcriptional regulator
MGNKASEPSPSRGQAEGAARNGLRPSCAQREGGHVLEMQRRRLLLAYMEVLAEHGLQGASVDRICKRAGVSRRTFYDLFIDREACFVAAFELALDGIAAEVVPAYMGQGRTRRAPGWRERVRAALTALLELFDSEPGLVRMCVVETLKAGPTILERRRAVLEVAAAAVDEGRREGRGVPPPPLTAEATVGGVVSVIHARLVTGVPAAIGGPRTGEHGAQPLVELVNPLMSMIVHPYLGPAAARRELEQPVAAVSAPARNGHAPARVEDPFKDLPIRITFRTARVLATIAASPGASNREVGDAAGIHDQGQISKLLRRLAGHALIDNHGKGPLNGEPNAWTLTERGQAIQRAIEPSPA